MKKKYQQNNKLDTIEILLTFTNYNDTLFPSRFNNLLIILAL